MEAKLKMKIEVKIISEECIKPSSPTPSHFKIYEISLLDQIMPATGIPMILFYSSHHPNLPINDMLISKRSLSLKQSLSETLTHFYPLAGKIKDNHSVDCNDDGVCYVEARANVHLREYLSQPVDFISLNHNLLPIQSNWYKPSPAMSYVTMIQETTFACGSIIIGVVCSHMVVDGTAMASFLKAWAATALSNSSKEIISPNFDAPFLFPQCHEFPKEATSTALCKPFLRTGKAAIRRLVFDASAIASLKAQAMSSSVENPTRVEVVSAFLSERITTILEAKSSSDEPILFTHAVDLRRRALPPFPENSLGNFVWLAPVIYSSKETKHSSLVCKMREAIREIDSNLVKNIQGGGGFIKLYEKVKEAFSRGLDYVKITSWCNFGLYDVDFGWGKPMWVSCIGSSGDSLAQFLNIIVLMDARMEKGIEAWVFLGEEDMTMLEKDEELFTFASLNPSLFN